MGIMPSLTIPEPMRPSAWWLETRGMRRPLLSKTPSTSVRKTRWEAPMATAMAPAAVSAFTFNSWHPSPPSANCCTAKGAITGIYPRSRRAWTGPGSTSRVLPATNPRLGRSILPCSRAPSAPEKPTALPLSPSSNATSCLLIRPANTAVTTSRLAASVTRRPSTNSTRMPSLVIHWVMAEPPPWTTTGLMPWCCIATMSARELS
uniref:Uncharacterized protein n=1 Tax=uncultured marine microorganism HF4000_APKG7H23 TaxID=455551 RepID=B3T9W4_9ZZZZ|nr:hypothetical protein ALOHA_HF4000APKG7H23ctg3g38 [uncultured marine microorganism HF4000_APKG7H23]